MKKIIKIVLSLFLSISISTLYWSNCNDISRYSKYKNIDILKSKLVKIWEKIVNKNPDKINTYISILTNIWNKRILGSVKKDVILLLKDYFICKQSEWLVVIKKWWVKYFKSLTKTSKWWLRDTLIYALNSQKGRVFQNWWQLDVSLYASILDRNYSNFIFWGRIKEYNCANEKDYLNVKFFVPPWLKYIRSYMILTNPTIHTHRVYYKVWIKENVLDRTIPETIGTNYKESLLLWKTVFKKSQRDILLTTFNWEWFFPIAEKNNWTWVYASYIFDDNNFLWLSHFTYSWTYKIWDWNKFKAWLYDDNNFDINWEPLENIDSMKIKTSTCSNWVQEKEVD